MIEGLKCTVSGQPLCNPASYVHTIAASHALSVYTESVEVSG